MARGRDEDVDAIRSGGRGVVTHLREQTNDLLRGQAEGGVRVDVGRTNDEGTGLELRGDLVAAIGVHHADGLDDERLGAVLGEHGHDRVDDKAELGRIGRGRVDEDVARVERDLGLVAVDDRRHRADLA